MCFVNSFCVLTVVIKGKLMISEGLIDFTYNVETIKKKLVLSEISKTRKGLCLLEMRQKN